MPLKDLYIPISASVAALAVSLTALFVAIDTQKTTSRDNQAAMEELATKIENIAKPVSGEEFVSNVESALEEIVQARQAQRDAEVQKRQATAQAATGDLDSIPVSMNKNGEMVFGAADAKYSIRIFEDFRCGYCTRYHPIIKQQVAASGGEINAIFRPFPILGPQSTDLASAGVCIAQEEGAEAFWKFAEAAYQSKDMAYSIERAGVSNPADIQSCINQDRYADRIAQSMNEGRDLGVTGTPASLFVNNQSGKQAFIKGFIEGHQIQQVIAEAL